MAVYRLKTYLEDNEDIYREIEILSSQTFEMLHNAIQEAYKFDKKHAASFFVSDDYWRKGQEITLREEDLAADEEDIRKKREPKKLMASVKIAKYIDNPRQRFVYVFDPQVQWTFCLELMKILGEDPKIAYPACVRSIGNPPKQYKQSQIAKGELSPDQAMAAMVNDLEAEDEEIYKTIKTEEHGIDDGDLETLEGEEGDEESEEEGQGEDGEEGSDDMGFDDFEEGRDED
ncbi:MAG: hypothetical protein JST26_14290 [Bacteroidetes bacterium]|nr:hypothetical protein [Bacteroidota bacterium]